MANLAAAVKRLIMEAVGEKAPPPGHEFYGNQYSGGGGGSGGERIKYQPTAKQEAAWDALKPVDLPSDDYFRERWAREHHGKMTGWGMGKRDWIVSNMSNTREYQTSLWQGRVDAAQGLEYTKPDLTDGPNINAGNLGYYRGYSNYASDRRGWDAGTRSRFDAQYGRKP